MSALIQLPPKPIARKLVPPPEDYEALAASIGFMPGLGGLAAHKIRSFLAEKSIAIYEESDVNAYMDTLALKEKKSWKWLPLRKRDSDLGLSLRAHVLAHPPKITFWEDLCGKTRDFYHMGDISKEIYSRPIPAEHLRNVRTIQEHLSDAGFFVTDYPAVTPDPFIAVMSHGTGPIVVGVWDEPGFGT